MSKQLIKDLPTNLDQAELAAVGNRLGTALDELAELKAEAKETATAYKSQCGELDQRISVMGRELHTKVGQRPQDVSVERNDRAGTLSHVRLDTGEVFFSRALTAEERQTNLHVLPGQAEG